MMKAIKIKRYRELKNKISASSEDSMYEKKQKEYKSRYNEELGESIGDLENILLYLLSRDDVTIEKDYEYYNITLRLPKTLNNDHNHIYMRIRHDSIFLQIEEGYESKSVNIDTDTFLEKYNLIIEKKYFDYIKRNAKNVIQKFGDMTNYNRKNKILKFIETK